VVVHKKELHITTHLDQVFSPCGDVKKIVRFQTMGYFQAPVNVYSHRDAIHVRGEPKNQVPGFEPGLGYDLAGLNPKPI